jgi:hypothetical protein
MHPRRAHSGRPANFGEVHVGTVAGGQPSKLSDEVTWIAPLDDVCGRACWRRRSSSG